VRVVAAEEYRGEERACRVRKTIECKQEGVDMLTHSTLNTVHSSSKECPWWLS